MGLTLTDEKRQILFILRTEPQHGYALAKDLDKQAPTVYEHLQELEKAGYIEAEEVGRRRVYSLTESGELILKADDIS